MFSLSNVRVHKKGVRSIDPLTRRSAVIRYSRITPGVCVFPSRSLRSFSIVSHTLSRVASRERVMVIISVKKKKERKKQESQSTFVQWFVNVNIYAFRIIHT